MGRYREQKCINPNCIKAYEMPKNSLCGWCQDKLNDYDGLKEKFNKLESREVNAFKLPNECNFMGRSSHLNQDDKEIAEFDKNFINLLKDISISSSTGAGGQEVGLSPPNHHFQRKGFVFELSTKHSHLIRFLRSIEGLCKKSYANGVGYGRNLLFQLNNGDITPTQLEGKVKDVVRR